MTGRNKIEIFRAVLGVVVLFAALFAALFLGYGATP